MSDKVCGGKEKTLDEECMRGLETSEFKGTQDEKEARCKVDGDRNGMGKLCQFLGNAVGGYFTGINPLNSLATLTNTIQDITNPEASVSKTCTAEQRLSTSLKAINKEIDDKVRQLKEAKEKLKQLGG